MTDTLKFPLRIGMIGCGAIAELYHLPALAQASRVRIALADSNAQRLAAMNARFGAAATFGDYRELEGQVDGVIVATPPAAHYPIAKWFLERGVHVLCEKPLTESLDEARELVRLADDHGVQLAVNQTRRLYPTTRKIRQLIEQGVLGRLHSITYHDGGLFSWAYICWTPFVTGSAASRR
jgi:predicted dehydrogenase